MVINRILICILFAYDLHNKCDCSSYLRSTFKSCVGSHVGRHQTTLCNWILCIRVRFMLTLDNGLRKTPIVDYPWIVEFKFVISSAKMAWDDTGACADLEHRIINYLRRRTWQRTLNGFGHVRVVCGFHSSRFLYRHISCGGGHFKMLFLYVVDFARRWRQSFTFYSFYCTSIFPLVSPKTHTHTNTRIHCTQKRIK